MAACVIQRRSRRFLTRCAALAAQVQERTARMQYISTLQARARTFLAQQQLHLLRCKVHLVKIQRASRKFLVQRRLVALEVDRNEKFQKHFCLACHLDSSIFYLCIALLPCLAFPIAFFWPARMYPLQRKQENKILRSLWWLWSCKMPAFKLCTASGSRLCISASSGASSR